MEYGKFYLIIRKIAQLVFPKYKAAQLEPTDKPVVYVSHHQNMFGPVNILLWYPKFMRLWGLSVNKLVMIIMLTTRLLSGLRYHRLLRSHLRGECRIL